MAAFVSLNSRTQRRPMNRIKRYIIINATIKMHEITFAPFYPRAANRVDRFPFLNRGIENRKLELFSENLNFIRTIYREEEITSIQGINSNIKKDKNYLILAMIMKINLPMIFPIRFEIEIKNIEFGFHLKIISPM